MEAKTFRLFLAIVIVIIIVGFAISRGVYVGSSITKMDDGYWHLVCKHLYPSGVHRRDTGGWKSPQEAKDNRSCPLVRS